MVRQIDPAGIERRTRDLYRRRGEYIVPGPDYIWSCDGHDKLAKWGVQIYAAIDAYSRHIVWLYVGVSNRTMRSILYQYLQAVKAHKFAPRALRLDRGIETLFLAEAQFAMHRTSGSENVENLTDCVFYGTSQANQRIESWWAQLEKSCLGRWRVSNCRTIYCRNY